MLNCDLCDYYSELPAREDGRTLAQCAFSGVTFTEDVRRLDIEYPCSGLSYETYLSRKEAAQADRTDTGDDWRYVYRKPHLAAYTERLQKRCL